MGEEIQRALYRTSPIEVVDGIPVFSVRDKYIDNYTQIAADHLKSMQPGMDNPFIENELWQQLETSTRTLISKYVPAGSRVLDIGVGLGRVLAPLDNLDRYGIDISFDYLRKARDNGINVAFSKLEDLPYQNCSFDAVVACDVLEHVLDLHEGCRNILRVLRPGGVLIVRVPFKEDLEAYLSEDLPYEYIHLRSFDEASLRLHFTKIFSMRFVEAKTVAPYLQGLPRLKLQLLSKESIARIKAHARLTNLPLSRLRKVTKVSAEDFVDWIYALRDKHPDEYKKVVDDLVHGIEINAIFIKR